MKNTFNIESLGQVMTSDSIVKIMTSLKKNKGLTLEPSCGTGNFTNICDVCIEKDISISHRKAIIMDFFNYPVSNKFDTIIGNPPYVSYKNICTDTKELLDMSLFDMRSNLYLFFIKKCIDHLNHMGELIFIVPRDLLKSTSAKRLNQFMFENGTIKTVIETGDDKIFETAQLNCIIFRYVKGDTSHMTDNGLNYLLHEGQVIFSNKKLIPFKDMFYCKVGAVSGLDNIFAHEDGTPFVYSKTRTNGSLKKMLYNIEHEYLKNHKSELLNRKIKN